MPVRTIFDRPLRRDPILLVWALAVGFTGGVALQHHTTWSGSLQWARVAGFLNEFCSGALTSFLVLALLPACLRWLWRHGTPWNPRVVGRHRAGLHGRPGVRPGVRPAFRAEAQPDRVPQRTPGETPCQHCPARMNPADPGAAAGATAVVEASGFDLLDQGRRLRAGAAHVAGPAWLHRPGECREETGHTGAVGGAAPAPPVDPPGTDRRGGDVPAAGTRSGELHPATAEVPQDGVTARSWAEPPEVVVPAPRIDLPQLPVLATPRPEVSLPRVDIDLPGARFTVRRTGRRSGDGRPGEAP